MSENMQPKRPVKENELAPGERRWSIIAHASTFLTYFIAMGSATLETAGIYNLLTPWILQLFMRKKPFARGQAKEAFLFQILLTAYFFFIHSHRGNTNIVWVPLLILGIVLHGVNFITATIVVLFKKDFHYPLSPFYHFRKWRNKKYEKDLFLGKFDSKNQAAFFEKHLERLKAIRVKVRKIQVTIKNTSVNEKITSILASIDKIILNFEKDPSDINRYRQFLQYYPDATVKLLEKYQYLESSSENPEDIKESLDKVSSTLDSLKDAYEEYYKKLMDNDLMELNIETQLIEDTLKYDNFGKKN